MIPFLYATVILLLSVNLILGLREGVDLIQAKVASYNLPNGISSSDESKQETGSFLPATPMAINQFPPPPISATAALVEDLSSGFVFFVKDPDKKIPIASTTKIMTAFIAVSYFGPNDVLTVPDISLTGSTMGLKPGEKLTFRSLLYGMLLNSGNDAAYTVAANFPGGVSAFVEKMNQKVVELGLTNTHFDDPAGFDSPTHFSSAADLAKISSLVVENPQLARIVATKEVSVASIDKSVIHSLKNLNKLLDDPEVLGIKTGTTPEAKENLIGLVEKNGHKILTVVLGSDDRFGETQKLVDWVYAHFTWQ